MWCKKVLRSKQKTTESNAGKSSSKIKTKRVHWVNDIKGQCQLQQEKLQKVEEINASLEWTETNKLEVKKK